jgi:tetratricopeptide (TPR) repeat protein
MTVPAATVAAVAAGLAAMKTAPEKEPAVPEAPAIPEEMPSADDALAFLSKLAAGKEDQLRAEAEQEAESRMAEIMGRKPSEARAAEAAPEGQPAAALAAAALGAAAIAATQREETHVEVPEEMPSADDALAFLSKLAAGKEDQLRAQAEQEAEARMAAIMGRSGPLGPVPTIGTAPTPAAVIKPEAEVEIAAQPIVEETESASSVAEAELPDWLRAMRPTEAASETPEGELPEWLRAMRPSEESAEPGLVGLMEEEETPIEATSEALLPEWLLAQRPVEPVVEEVEGEAEAAVPLAEAAAAFGLLAALGEERPGEAEEAPAAPIQMSAALPFDWWVQTAGDTGEEALPDLPQPYLSPRARAAEKEKAAAAVAAVVAGEEMPSARKLPQTGPLRQTGPLALPQTGPLGTPEPAAVSAEVEMLLSRVYQDEQDHAARLDLARTYWATGNREGAYTEYLGLVNAGEFIRETMADLETIVEIHDQTDWHRMLGDVYMKVGRLPSALEHYRRALSEV